MLLLLTLAAGSMDSISYLGLGHVFTAMMTGNVVFLGLSIGQEKYFLASRGIFALIGFSLGVVVGEVTAERKPRNSDWPSSVTWALVIEALLLVLFVWLWYISGGERAGAIKYILIALSAFAMGIQSAAVGYLGVAGISTTYITGTLSTLMVVLLDRLRWQRRPRQNEDASLQTAGSTVEPSFSTPRIISLAAVILFYGIGAFVGSILHGNSSPIIEAGFPTLAVILVVLNAVIRHRLRRGRLRG